MWVWDAKTKTTVHRFEKQHTKAFAMVVVSCSFYRCIDIADAGVRWR
jgi:hypothetical protein